MSGGIFKMGLGGLLGGGDSPPPPPDYTKAAKETAAGNLEAAKYATNANRINQVTPYGSLTYSKAQPAFDQAGYDKALAAYNAGGDAPTYQNVWDGDGESGGWVQKLMGGGNRGTAPKREDFMGPDDGGGWTQTMSLDPRNQALLDKNYAMSNQYADFAQGEMNRLLTAPQQGQQSQGIGGQNSMSQAQQLANRLASGGSGFSGASGGGGGGSVSVNMPSIKDVNMDLTGLRNVNDLSLNGLPQAPINAGQTAQDALYSRMNPSLARDEEALRTRLANQGISLGSSAYNREMDLQGQRANDMRLQAAAQGLGLDQAARQSAFGEQQSIFNSQMGQRQQGLTEQQALANVGLTQRGQDVSSATSLGTAQIGASAQLGTAGIGANASLEAARMNAAINAQRNASDYDISNRGLSNTYDIQNRGLKMQEQLAPVNYINALRNNSQVITPQFQGFSQQANVAGPNMTQAAQLGYQGQMGMFNAGQARDEQTQNMLMQGAGLFFSDRRTKENIVKVGALDNGLNLYKFDYKPEFKELAGHGSYIGVMADEAKVIPDAVIRQPNGYDMVDYSKIYA
jgi:hypothetical protein